MLRSKTQDPSARNSACWSCSAASSPSYLRRFVSEYTKEPVFARELPKNFRAFAGTLGDNTAASLTFDDQKASADMLGALRGERHIQAACLYDNQGKAFAEIRRTDLDRGFQLPPLQSGAHIRFAVRDCRSRRITGRRENGLSSRSFPSLSGFRASHGNIAKIAGLVLLLSILGTYLVTFRFLRAITEPKSAIGGSRQPSFAGRELVIFEPRRVAPTKSAGSFSLSTTCSSEFSSATESLLTANGASSSTASRNARKSSIERKTWPSTPAGPRASSWRT